MKSIKNIIVFDTEFVSSKSGSQPFQIAMMAFRLNGNNLEKISDFEVYITLRKGIYLNRYAKECTGVDEATLKNEGIYPEMARKQVIEYLLNFNFQETILLGWDPTNDQRMFNILFNYNEEVLDVASFRWFDLARSYLHVNNLPIGQVPSLKTACDSYNLGDFTYHDATNDCKATTWLLEKMLQQYGAEKCLYEISETQVKKKIKRFVKQRVH